ncbi:hypothetical protein ACQKP6_28975, partial [Pseudomonas fluorescens]|uniref:hypothetical protein n=1 Tax=Pseudomonas fluorescens TaxID=294 RepID=UPI003D06CF2D
VNFTAIAFTEQQARLVIAEPAQQHGTATILEPNPAWVGRLISQSFGARRRVSLRVLPATPTVKEPGP